MPKMSSIEFVSDFHFELRDTENLKIGHFMIKGNKIEYYEANQKTPIKSLTPYEFHDLMTK